MYVIIGRQPPGGGRGRICVQTWEDRLEGVRSGGAGEKVPEPGPQGAFLARDPRPPYPRMIPGRYMDLALQVEVRLLLSGRDFLHCEEVVPQG